MTSSLFRWSLNAATGACIAVILLVMTGYRPSFSFLSSISVSQWQSLKTVGGTTGDTGSIPANIVSGRR